MVNLTYPEIAEISTEALPPASIDALKTLRTQACETTQQSGFKLQSQQRFLRRVLSPDAPNRSLLMVHGTGTGKTCTAIQVAEEYILRPEFQDKKVMVVASAAVQENFRTQLFEMNRVKIDTIAGTLESKQCTGRRYLDMLLRIESEPKNWNNPDIRAKLERTADRIISEFYDFTAYGSFGNLIMSKLGGTEKDIDREWVHANFDNRLLIVDEAHNIRESKDEEGIKGITRGLENLVKTADGLVLVCLTATPMFDTYDEILFYMNLFRWNDRKQDPKRSMKLADFFNPDATLKNGPGGDAFRAWCQDYVSYVKGENPFTFPFRLPPPKVVSRDTLKTSYTGKALTTAERIQYLDLVESTASGIQKTVLTRSEKTDEEEKKRALMQLTLAVLPENKDFDSLFRLSGKQYEYTVDPFLTPETLPQHSAKFSTVIQSIDSGTGVCMVYSNFVKMGALLFAMALEEHGFTAVSGESLLKSPQYKGQSKGTYILLTSRISEAEISKLLRLSKSERNRDGSQVRVIVAGPIVSEGVDFRYMRQIHVLDPWWNMSRIEQVVGRGLRTCSHQSLPFNQQNCTVYLHVIRTEDGKECFDEYTYRTKVEQKAMKIARVRKVIAESAMDCPLQNVINTLPTDWKTLPVPQTRSEGGVEETFQLFGMLAPSFIDTPDVSACVVFPSQEDPTHVRPLSTYLDVRDEVLVKLAERLEHKPIWERSELFEAMRPFTREVVIFNIQQAVRSGYRFKDSFGRPSVLESRGELYALAPIGALSDTLQDRISTPLVRPSIELPEPPKEKPTEVNTELIDLKREAFPFPEVVRARFSKDVLNGYIFDHQLTDNEKRSLVRTATLPFAKRLLVGDTNYVVLGKDTFDPPEQPIGDDLSAVRAWNADLVQRFIENKDKVFASLKNDKLTLSKMTVDGETITRKLDKSGKKFEPIVCDTGENTTAVMNAFAKFADSKGVGLPKLPAKQGKEAKEMTGPQRCMYIELLSREEHNCVWITPEELSCLYDGKGSKGQTTNQDTFTEAFRK